MDEDSLDRPLLVFDGECPFCRAWVDYWKRLTGERLLYVPYQEVAQRFPNVPRADVPSVVKLILPGGEVRSGAHAVFSLLELVPGKKWMLWLYLHVPGFALVAETAYRIFSRHRSFCYRATQLLWGIPVEVETFHIGSWLFLRVLGVIYLIAFTSFGRQAAGLIGSRGISPVAEFLHSVREYYGASGYWAVPTLLWLNSSDAMLKAVWIAGICLSALLLVGVQWRIIRFLLFVLYLSLVTAGQEFMGYQWDALLLEAGFLAILLGWSPIIIWLYRWLLFRLMFLSGTVKLMSGDESWRHFTALPVHYETQPLPTPFAWYMFQLPTWFQRGSVGFVFLVEVLVPCLIFAPRRVRFLAARAIIGLQVLILLTGNYAFFNLLTISFCLFLLDDALLHRIVPAKLGGLIRDADGPARRRVLSRAICGSFAALAFFVGSFQIANTFGLRWVPAQVLIRSISPFEIVNSYGLFAVMTTARPEIVIEGSNDGLTWVPYEFKYKPGDLTQHPAWVAPHQPRLDWQMWFAALGDYRSEPWILRFMARLLEGSPEVLGLLRRNPFPDSPPHFIRALLYQYRFTTASERRATGEWWHRELKGVYVPAVSLRDE